MLEHILFLTELWHLFDVNAMAGHGSVLAALLFLSYFSRKTYSIDTLWNCLGEVITMSSLNIFLLFFFFFFHFG